MLWVVSICGMGRGIGMVGVGGMGLGSLGLGIGRCLVALATLVRCRRTGATLGVLRVGCVAVRVASGLRSISEDLHWLDTRFITTPFLF